MYSVSFPIEPTLGELLCMAHSRSLTSGNRPAEKAQTPMESQSPKTERSGTANREFIPTSWFALTRKDKNFQVPRLLSGGGVVRNIAATKDSRLYLACGGVNKVAIAEAR
jgi:hypothetical protein